MSNSSRHFYHLVDESPWPILASVRALFLTLGLLKIFHSYRASLVLITLVALLLIMGQWWQDVSSEGALQGLHSSIVELGLRWGIALFIVSEVFFFLSFFWAFFHRRLAPSIELSQWPPLGVLVFYAVEVPLLTTIVLLASGITVTWAHHALMQVEHSKSILRLALTVFLGAYFTCLQGIEYYEASFRIADRTYGSTFFLATGFHGLHVLVGTSFLRVCLLRLFRGNLSLSHHFGFEAAAWYWHFVDVVWLFLFVRIYWWGGVR